MRPSCQPSATYALHKRHGGTVRVCGMPSSVPDVWEAFIVPGAGDVSGIIPTVSRLVIFCVCIATINHPNFLC